MVAYQVEMQKNDIFMHVNINPILDKQHMAPPLISIITPVLNASKTLEEHILSIKNQTYQHIEHIFIDGCSTDETLTFIREYQSSHPRVCLISEPDHGVYHAINKGLDSCHGNWIYIMGADDTLFDPRVISDLVEQQALKDEHVVYGNVVIRGECSWAKDGTVYDGVFTLKKLLLQNICHQSIFYPRSVTGKIGYYNEKYRVTADWDYNVHCFAHYPFHYVNRVIAAFRSGGISSNDDDSSFYLDLPEKVIEYFNLNPDDPEHDDPDAQFFYPVSRFRDKHRH